MNWRRHRGKLGPWALWLLCASLTVWFYADMNQLNRAVGCAYTQEYPVAPLDTGRVVSVAVELGQPVTAGQILATMDTGELDLEIAVLEASRTQALASYEAGRTRELARSMEQQGELSSTLARTERRLSEAETDKMVSQAELQVQEAELRRTRSLVSQQLADRGRLSVIEARVAQLRGRLRGAEASSTLLSRQLEDARTRMANNAEEAVEQQVAPLLREVDVLDVQLRGLKAQREQRVLRSPSVGHVSAVHLQVGAVAGPEQPLVTVVAAPEGKVVACMAEAQALEVRLGDSATVWPRTNPERGATGRVVSLGPLVGEVSPRCQPNLGPGVYGRDVMILLDEPTPLLPGQAVDVEVAVQEEGASGSAHAWTPPDERAASPGPMELPESLKQRTRFEPSGAVWVPQLMRYVVVSDDTGHPGRDEHAPWLFTMDTQGRLDPAPMAVQGLKEIRDLESIAARADGTLYALSSQSRSRKGKRPDARQLFVRLRPTALGFEVTGQVRLASLLDDLSPAALSSLGLKETDTLDIEAMTWRGDELLLGLKAPLTDDGRAQIWRIKHPDALLEGGSLSDAGLTLWATVPLKVGVAGEELPGGIADLVTLMDGSVVLAATSPEAQGRAQDGGLWWVADPRPGTLKAKHVRTFQGLKPEGLALSPQAGRLIVTIDRGQETPFWVELERPH